MSSIASIDAPRTSVRQCPGCNAGHYRMSLGSQDGFPWRICADCGCRYTVRRPSEQELSHLYGTYYRKDNLVVPDFIQQRLDEIVRSFDPHRGENHLMDVGFGAGGLLAAAEQAGWHCWGTEISAAAIVAGRRRGWRVLEGDLCKIGLPSDLFDVVCMVEVLEHLERPIDYLRQAFHLLRPGGLLYATTPNAVSLNSRFLGLRWPVYGAPEHLQLFTPRAMRDTLDAIGFQTVRVFTEGLNPSQLRALLPGRIGAGAPLPDYGQAGRLLNELLSTGRFFRVLKRGANTLLASLGIGDSIKIFAVKS